MVDERINVQFTISYCTVFLLLTHTWTHLQTNIILWISWGGYRGWRSDNLGTCLL